MADPFDFTIIVVLLVVSFVLSGILYGRFGDYADPITAIGGLFIAASWLFSALFLMIGGGPLGKVVGAIMITVVLFFARNNKEKLDDTDWRASLSGN